MRKFGLREALAAFVGTALFAMLTEVQIPFPMTTGIAFEVRAGLIASFAAIFGPAVAGLIGFAGHAAADAIFCEKISWSWVAAEALFGFVIGLFVRWFRLGVRSFGAREILLFNLVQVFANVLAWIAVAPVLDILFFAEPASKVYRQGAIACISDILTVAVFGTLFVAAYSRSSLRTSGAECPD